jgi:O-antigen ligase
VGLGQIIHRAPLGLPGELALAADQPGASVVPVAGQVWLRAYGLTFHPNVLGGFLAVSLIIGLPLLVKPYMRALWCLLCLGTLLTLSRSAWLAVTLVLPPVMMWLAYHQPALRRPLLVTLTGIAVLAVLGTVFLIQPLQVRSLPLITGQPDTSLEGRLDLLSLAISAIASRPLMGTGAGNSPLLVLATGTMNIGVPIHNVPLLLATEVGVLGAGIWLWMWLAPAIVMLKYSRYPPVRRDGTVNTWPVVLSGAWFALGIIGLWDYYPWALNAGRLLTVTLLGLISRTLEES